MRFKNGQNSKKGKNGRANGKCEKGVLLDEIQKYASWDGKENEMELSRKVQELLTKHPEAKEEAEARMKLGRFFQECKSKAYKLGSSEKPEADLLPLEKALKQKGLETYLLKKLQESYEK